MSTAAPAFVAEYTEPGEPYEDEPTEPHPGGWDVYLTIDGYEAACTTRPLADKNAARAVADAANTLWDRRPECAHTALAAAVVAARSVYGVIVVPMEVSA